MFTSAEKSPLFKSPGPEADAAWVRLLDNASLRFSEEELLRFNSSSIDLQESTGKLAWLEVSHQIHCVVSKILDTLKHIWVSFDELMMYQDYLRKAINRNHYYPGLSDSEWQKYIKPHIGTFKSISRPYSE